MRLQHFLIVVAIMIIMLWLYLRQKRQEKEDEDLYDVETYQCGGLNIPNPKNTTLNKKIIIYILCHNDERYSFALNYFKNLEWARPVKMKYQDITWENAFWKQLAEMEDEWRDAYMVGTMSAICYKKLNLTEVNNLIVNNKYIYPYHHFMDTNIPLEYGNSRDHPHFSEIWDYMLQELGLETVTENYCNYWMCTPEYMKRFLVWYEKECLPTILNHPLSFSDAKYTHMSKESLIKKWGKPYYPHIPFILERLHKAYFIKLMKG